MKRNDFRTSRRASPSCPMGQDGLSPRREVLPMVLGQCVVEGSADARGARSRGEVMVKDQPGLDRSGCPGGNSDLRRPRHAAL